MNGSSLVIDAGEEENEDGKSDGMPSGSGGEDESEDEGKSAGNSSEDETGEDDSRIISQMEGPGAGVGSPSDEPYIPHSQLMRTFVHAKVSW